MNNIWLVQRDFGTVDYDEYDSFVVRAKDKDEAIELAMHAAYAEWPRKRAKKAVMAADHQNWRKATVTQVPVWSKSAVILGSFKAG